MKFLKETILANFYLFLGAFLILITNPFRFLSNWMLKQAQKHSGEEIFLKNMKEKYEEITRARDEESYRRKSDQLDQKLIHSPRHQEREEFSEGSSLKPEQEGNLDSKPEEGAENSEPSRTSNSDIRAQARRRVFTEFMQKEENSSLRREGDFNV